MVSGLAQLGTYITTVDGFYFPVPALFALVSGDRVRTRLVRNKWLKRLLRIDDCLGDERRQAGKSYHAGQGVTVQL